jgi:chaperonin GroES
MSSEETTVETQPESVEEEQFTWEPFYDKIVVRRRKPKETYDAEGKIKVAETHQQTQNRGIVVAVGPGRLSPHYGTVTPLSVMIGQEVLFGKHSGTDMEEDPELVMLREDELLAKRWPED